MAVALRSLTVCQRSPPGCHCGGGPAERRRRDPCHTSGYWILDGDSWEKASEKTRIADNYYYDNNSDLYCYGPYCSAVKSETALITSPTVFLIS